jgi:UPF0042 nucleotide-binding protein
MADQMRLIIVSGLSGSGKSVALHVLEDLGYYCVDNLPAALLNSVVEEVRSGGDNTKQLLAVGVDARNRRNDLESLPQLISDLENAAFKPTCCSCRPATTLFLNVTAKHGDVTH